MNGKEEETDPSAPAGIVGIVTDSAAAIPTDIAHDHGIKVAQMHITADGRSAGEDLFSEQDLIAAMGRPITTSAPSPGEFAAAISAADQGAGVVVITVGSRFSASATSARLGADVSGSRVKVVDSGSAAGGQALVVLAAAETARQGEGLDAVAERAVGVASRVRLVAAVDDLAQLAKSGRIPAIAQWAGNRLGVQVLFELSEASAKPLAPARNRSAANRAVLRTWRRSALADSRLHIAALHSRDRSDAEELLAAIEAEITPATAIITRFSPVMMAHTGPGVRGLAWWWEEV